MPLGYNRVVALCADAQTGASHMTDINELADKVRAAKAALDAFVPKHELEDDYELAKQALLDAVVASNDEPAEPEADDWVVKPDFIDATEDEIPAQANGSDPYSPYSFD